MHKWEYLELKILLKVYTYRIEKNGKTTWIIDNNQTLQHPVVMTQNETLLHELHDKDYFYPPLHNILQKLGEQGWEVVNFVRDGGGYYGQTDYMYCYLKRPLE